MIGVHPVDNRIGDFNGHVGKGHQCRFGLGRSDRSRGHQFHQRVQVQFRRFVGNPIAERGTRRVPFGAGDDAEAAATAVRGRIAQDHGVKHVRLTVKTLRGWRVPIEQQAGNQIDPRIGQRPGLHLAAEGHRRLGFDRHEFGKRVGPQSQKRHHDQHDQEDRSRTQGGLLQSLNVVILAPRDEAVDFLHRFIVKATVRAIVRSSCGRHFTPDRIDLGCSFDSHASDPR